MSIKSKFKDWKQKADQKAAEVKEDLRFKTKQAANWVYNNKENIESAIVVGTAVAGVTVKVVKTVNKLKNEKKAYDNKRSYYDHSLQKRIKFKRVPAQWELEEARSRHSVDDESYYDIYKDLDLI